MASKKTKDRKYQLASELEEHFDNYKKLFIVDCDNVGSDQMHGIRKAMRGEAVVYCGKNTQMRRVIRTLEESRPELEKIRQAMKLNVALVFTNGDLSKVRDAIVDNKKPSAAKAGSFAQCDVTIEKGITALEPSMTQFLQALNIGSKITKGMIEIINDVELFKEGDKIGASQAALLQKLDITPFEYGLVPKLVFDNGSLFEPAVLDIQESQIIAQFQNCLRNAACVSIGLGKFPTVASVPYSIMIAFANMLAVACELDFSFPQAEEIKAYLADPSAFASAAPAGGSTAAASTTKAAAVEEESEEEEMAGGPGLFDAGGDDY